MTNLDYTAAKKTRADLLIFGSSRARRHYDTRILKDSLGMSAFNCGYNSMGIEFFIFRLEQVLERYNPKVIIYDITPFFDLMNSNSEAVNKRCFKPYFFEPTAYNAMRDIDFTEWIKCHSATYRLHDALYDFHKDHYSTEKFYDGYAPLVGTKGIVVKPHGGMRLNPDKVKLWEKFIGQCIAHRVKLFFVLSPYYKNDMGDQAEALRAVAGKYGVPIFDHFNDSRYVNDSTLYWDASHLNAAGATLFTRTIASSIKPYL